MIINLLPALAESLVLVAALSVDSFVACFGYGTAKIKIPFLSGAVMDLLSSGILLLFLLFGRILSPLLSPLAVRLLCFFVLFTLGIVKLFDSSLKALIRRNGQNIPKLQFSLLHFRFILTVYADPDRADTDRSSLLSPREAVSLGLALSLDSAAVGLGAGVTALPIGYTLFLALLVGGTAIFAGCRLGNKVAEKTSLNLSWLSGLLLLALAFIKFL